MNPDQPIVPPRNTGDEGNAPSSFEAPAPQIDNVVTPTMATPAPAAPQPVPQPVVPSAQIFAPAETNMPQFGASDSKPRGSRSLLKILVPVVVVVAALVVYGWVIPSSRNHAYLSKVKPAYSTQASKMKAVYDTFSLPTFTSNTTSPDTDAQTFAQANVDLKLATSATNALQADNHWSSLPGTSWFGSNKKTQQQYAAMKQYISDSQAFLANYQQLVTYASSSEQIANKQSQPVIDALSGVAGAPDFSTVLSSCQRANDLLKTMVNDLSALTPPADLKDYNATLLKNLGDISTALQGIINGINAGDSAKIEAAASQLDQAGTTLENFNPDVSSKLQTNSQIHTQLEKLKSENPLS